MDSLYESSKLSYKSDDHTVYSLYASNHNLSYVFSNIPFKFWGIKDADEAEKKDCFSYLEKDIAKFLANPLSMIDEIDFKEPTGITIYIKPSDIIIKLPDGSTFLPETQNDFFEMRRRLASGRCTEIPPTD